MCSYPNITYVSDKYQEKRLAKCVASSKARNRGKIKQNFTCRRFSANLLKLNVAGHVYLPSPINLIFLNIIRQKQRLKKLRVSQRGYKIFANHAQSPLNSIKSYIFKVDEQCQIVFITDYHEMAVIWPTLSYYGKKILPFEGVLLVVLSLTVNKKSKCFKCFSNIHYMKKCQLEAVAERFYCSLVLNSLPFRLSPKITQSN